MTTKNSEHYFLSGGGEMGELIRAKDWGKTALGDPSDWPQSLRTMVAVMLDNPFGMYIAWGSEFLQLYNDGYRPILGANKHPWALGISTRETFSEVWHIIESMFDGVMEGKAVGFPDLMLPLNRNGFVEKCYFDFAYSPIRKDNGEVGGVLVTVIETTDKKKTENQLKESEERFKLSLSGSNQIVFSQDKDLKHTWIHNTHPDFKQNDIIGKTDKDLHVPESAAVLTSIKQKVLDTGNAFNGDIEIEIGGKKANCSLHIEAIKDSEETITGIIGTSIDITERKKIERRIKESEEQFSTLAENMENHAWLADGEGSVYWFNKRWFAYTGMSLEDVKGWGWQKVHHPDHVERVVELFKKIWHTNKAFELTYPIRRRDGAYRWFLTRGHPVTDEGGKIIRWIGTSTDIDEQKKAEEQFRVLADQAPMWVWLTDKEVNVLYANSELLRFIGISHYTEFTGTIWEEKVHPEDVTMVYKSFGEAADLQQSFSLEYRVQNAQTQQYEWFYVKGVPRLEGGEFTGFIGTGININEQKLILSQLEYGKTLLESHNEASIDGILLVDTKGKILSYNHCFVEIWNIPQQILDDKDDEKALAFALTQLEDPDQFIKKVKWLYENPDEISKDELEFKDGKIIKRYGYHVTGVDGKYYGCSWIFRDITEQTKSERTLKESEERFRSLAQTLPQLIWMTDAEGNQEFVSSRWQEYSGIELIGEKEWREIVHPEDYDNINAAWTHSLSTGYTYTCSVRLKSKHSEYRWHVVKGEPVLGATNKIVKWVGSFTDIHAEKTFTTKLEKQVSERTLELTKKNIELENKTIQLEEAQQLAHIGSWEWDVRTTKLNWSDELYRILGLKPQEFKADYENSINYVYPDDREYVKTIVQKAFVDLQPYNFFHRALTADGNVRILSVTGKVITDGDGNVIRMSGTAQDVTEQKKYEEELKRSKERFFKIFDSNPIPMTLTKIKTNKIKYANNLFYDAFGYTKEEVIGNSSEELNLLDPEEYKRVIYLIFGYLNENRSLAEVQALSKEETEELLLKLNQSGKMKDFEILYTRKNGETFPAIVSYEVIRIGAESFTVTSYQDITARKKAEAKLTSQNDQLEKMNKELESFAYVSSHDLQEPLRKIQTFASRIREKEENNLSDKGKEMFNRMQDAAKRMQTLIQDLLAYSRSKISEEKIKLTDLNKIVGNVKKDLEEELEEKQATIEANELGEAPIIPFQFRQLMNNLVGNSLKYSDPEKPPHIKIKSEIATGIEFNNEKLSPQIKYCHITVSDNGIGFEQKYSERIFEVFQRLHGRNEYTGTGVGLSIVKKIVENHKGIITAYGELNKGATFNIYIPIE